MNSKGFTLIELVVVIVILGILAVSAVPKYINLQADAQTATLEGVKAAMQGASALVYGKSIVAGNQKIPDSNTPQPTIMLTNGSVINTNFGYPVGETADWNKLLDLNTEDFKVSSVGGARIAVHPASVIPFDETEACIVVYFQATATNPPIIVVNPCL